MTEKEYGYMFAYFAKSVYSSEYRSEVNTSGGRVDHVIDLDDKTLIIEFKLDNKLEAAFE